MARSKQLVNAIKVELKRNSVTYRQLAERLDVSESTVKQMFAGSNFSLARLDAICDILDTDINALMEVADSMENRITHVDLEFEKALVKDQKLLVVAYCLANHWKVDEILDHYQLEETELVTLLAKLDRMKFLELLPNNKVRLLIANNFHWRPNGPIERYFRSQVQTEFFNTSFDDEGAMRVVKNGLFSKKGQMDLHQRLKMIDSLFDEIDQQERRLPLKDREGVTMILAIRSWQPSLFTSLERRRPA